MEQNFYNVIIGRDYPNPIVDLEATRKAASEQVWSFRKTAEAKREGARILEKYVNPSSNLKSKRKDSLPLLASLP